MKPRLRTALLATGLITGLVRSAEPASPAVIDYTEPPPDALRAGEQLTLLHDWPGTLVFGFDGQGRLRRYDSDRQVFEAPDLAAPDAPARVWKNPGTGIVVSGAFSPDRRTLATVHSAAHPVSGDQAMVSRIRLWNVETGEPIERTFKPSDAGYVAFSVDGKSLFGMALDGSGNVTVWDVVSGEIRQRFPLPPLQPHLSCSGVQSSPTGRHLAADSTSAVLTRRGKLKPGSPRSNPLRRYSRPSARTGRSRWRPTCPNCLARRTFAWWVWTIPEPKPKRRRPCPSERRRRSWRPRSVMTEDGWRSASEMVPSNSGMWPQVEWRPRWP